MAKYQAPPAPKEDPPAKKHADAIAAGTYVAFCNAMGGGKPKWLDLPIKEKRAWMVASRNAVLQAKHHGVEEALAVANPFAPEVETVKPTDGEFVTKEG